MENSGKKPKVALMSYSMDNRTTKGIALYTRKLIEGLLPIKEFDFYLVHYDKVSDPLYKEANEIVMPKVKLPYGSHFISQMLFFWKYRRTPFDVIHWFHPRVYPFYWLAPAKKIIVTVHGAGDITAPTQFVFSRMVFNFVLKHFHKWIFKIIVDSKFAKEEVIEHYGFPEKKVEVIYLGGGEVFQPLDKEESLKIVNNKFNFSGQYILDVSRLQPHKNVVSLILSYDLMRKKFPTHKEKLFIIGGSVYEEGDEMSLEHITAKKSIFSSDITFTSFVDKADLNSIYSGAELFVFPSLNEGFGLPVIEAMGSGVPVVTSNITSMPEIGGEAVHIVDPLNIGELSQVMHNILSDSGVRLKMIKLGLDRAKKFTWQSTVEKTKDLYQ